MMWELDSEIGQVLAPLLEQLASIELPPVGEVGPRRELIEGLLASFMSALPQAPEVSVRSETCTATDGVAVPLRLYTPQSASGALVLYVHGGGMIMGSVELYDPLLRYLAASSGAALLAVDYRVAPEHPHPTPVDDCYAALVWASENAATLGGDANRLAVAGDSGGGGLAAAVALLARDRGGPALAHQILIYPMLDDRNVQAPIDAPAVLTWTYDDNATGWGALLGDAAGGPDVSPYAAPARAEDVSGLPPAYVMVGDMDIFRDEDIAYAARMTRSGVPVEFHLHPGAPHAFDLFGPETAVGQRAYEDEIRILRSI